MARERDPEDLVYPKRRWPWFVLLAFVLAAGAIAGFVTYVRSAHLATFRLEGPHGCDVRVVYGSSTALVRRTVTLPWEAGTDVRGGDVLLLSANPTASCATVAIRCSIDIDTHPRTTGAEACAEYAGRAWTLVPGLR